MAKSNNLKYELVSTFRRLHAVVNRCKKLGETALDFETTSLSPASGRVRLVSLRNTKTRVLVDFDRIKGGFEKCAHLFKGGTWIVFYSGFEGRWFRAAGADPTLYDVGYLRRAILGGGRFSLANMALWDLNIEMSKDEQASDWGSRLTRSQLDYAYFDAYVTWRLWRGWAKQADEGHWSAFHMLNDMVPAVIEMEDAGMLFDSEQHAKLVKDWYKIHRQKTKLIRGLVPTGEVANINSDSQWSDYFAARLPDTILSGWPRTEKTGQLSMKVETLRRLGAHFHGTPMQTFMDGLADYKKVSKYLSSFGESLITSANLAHDGRIHARYNIGAAKTLRFSSSGPNVQQTPRDFDLLGKFTSIRKSFVAPRGMRLVSLDYSGIELRVLALLSGDEQLLDDVVNGDVHAEVAAVVAGAPIDRTTRAGKAARQSAKGISFGIIYGSGAMGLAATMRTSVDRAQGYIDFWQDRYPDAFRLRYDMMDEVSRTRRIRMVEGGTVYMGKKPDLPKCANYPVQRAALSVMAMAIKRHKDSLDKSRANYRQKRTRMLATIHDALIDEAETKDAPTLLKIMKRDMVAGYLDIFPDAPTERLVEGGIGPSWGQLE